MIIKLFFFVVFVTELFSGQLLCANEGSVFLFNDFSQSIFLDDIDVRDSQNRIVRNAIPIHQLRSLFVVSLHQLLLVRDANVSALISSIVKKPLFDFNALKKSGRRNIQQIKEAVAAIIQKFEKIIVSLVFLSAFLVILSKVFISNYRQPPAMCQTFEVLRC